MGKEQSVSIGAGSLVYRSYGQDKATERFVCNYGLNPKFRDTIEKGQLKVTGVDLDGEARVIEHTDHPFFIGTLYQPQISSAPGRPHPLIVSYLKAAWQLN